MQTLNDLYSFTTARLTIEDGVLRQMPVRNRLEEEADEMSFTQRAEDIMRMHGSDNELYNVKNKDEFISRVLTARDDAEMLSANIGEALISSLQSASASDRYKLTEFCRMLDGVNTKLSEVSDWFKDNNLLSLEFYLRTYTKSEWNVYFLVNNYILPAARLLDEINEIMLYQRQ